MRSRKNVDAETMYEMRRQGMTNHQIAKSLDCAVATVYRYIGRKSEAVKHAEVQHKPPVVDKATGCTETPKIAPETVPEERPTVCTHAPILTVLSAKYTMQGELCQYVIDTAAKTVEMPDSGSIVSGFLDVTTIPRFIAELNQVYDMMAKGVGA